MSPSDSPERVVWRGQRYRVGTDVITITRVAVNSSWADIRVRQPHGAQWSKRMLLPLPDRWVRER